VMVPEKKEALSIVNGNDDEAANCDGADDAVLVAAAAIVTTSVLTTVAVVTLTDTGEDFDMATDDNELKLVLELEATEEEAIADVDAVDDEGGVEDDTAAVLGAKGVEVAATP